ncbi:very short patch repair endonuclease [Micromonospora echinofusca]|uniref:very short patch repair endonuclease n=1 Tax=Micromonospora echinofusca TaxID=47858 RepID=UPI0024C22C21|nr:very short patch repair endonuclease [Micromonospora sp. MSM11]
MKSSPGTSPAAPQPAPLSEQVSNQMKRMRRASTKPELLIRRALHRRGLRFRVNHPALPGRPDIAFTRVRLAIFIDGCFWHMCPKHGVMPKNNREWWQAKLHRNVERDREKDAALMDLGWHVRHFWEHDDPAAAAEEIEKAWQHLRTSPEPDS